MPRLVAFLRAINVGGHTVTMEALRGHFGRLGLGDVETFIASGNVIFSASARDIGALERRIEHHLLASLGYEVKTFLRTMPEVAAVAAHEAFTPPRIRSAIAFNVAFLAEPLGAAATRAVMAMRTDIDDFHVDGREVYWLCTKKQSESGFSNAVLERVLRTRATFRSASTVARIAAKYGGTAGSG